jgi:nucleobase transporter 1/2
MSHENRTELWQIRMRELSGAIAVSAILQAAIGYLGELTGLWAFAILQATVGGYRLLPTFRLLSVTLVS